MTTDFSLSGKWLELLKEIFPAVTRAAVLRDTEIGTGTSQFAVIQALGALDQDRGEPDQHAKCR